MTATIEYIEGDLFNGLTKLRDTGTVVIAHVCNDKGVMGAGFVMPLERAYPHAKRAYQEWYRGKEIKDSLCQVTSTGPCQLGQTQFVQVQQGDPPHELPRVIVANMVAQTLGGKRRPLYYNHLVRCMNSVASLVTTQGWFAGKLSIICPMFGGGLAGGDWRFIHELIEDIWQRENSDLIKVTVYYLEQFVKKTDWEVMDVDRPEDA